MIQFTTDNVQLFDTLASEMPELLKELSSLSITARAGKSLCISKKGKDVTLNYTSECNFFRALSHLRGKGIEEDFNLCDNADLNMLCFMLDCSRNGVINEDSFISLVKMLALMGYNSIMLYTEDTYEIPLEPFFGHLRGRFNGEELQFMVNYAAKFGIELIPCIQTLAHLETMFKWPEYANINDVTDILLCESEETYELIDRMFASLASNFKSRRVNIGMDEAHLVGLGNYLDKHGYQNRTDIMLRHLNKVVEIAGNYGFRCCMWSDMFFRLAYKTYRVPEDAPRLNKSVTSLVPKEVDLVYWDYHRTETQGYDDMFRRHFDFDNKTMFAGGAWRWTGLTPNNKYGLLRVIPGIQACKKNSIKEVIVTSWGDNGNETSFYAALPQILVYAEYLYQDNPDEQYLEQRMKQIADASYRDFLTLDIANTPHDYEDYTRLENRSKTLLYNDPLLGIMDHIAYDGIGADYQKAAQILTDAGKRNLKWRYLFDTQATLCTLLSFKADLGIKLKAAYDSANKQKLESYAGQLIPTAIDKLEKFAETLRTQWYNDNKTFGFEVIQIRLGGLKERLIETKRRLTDYLSGKVDKIAELEQKRLVRHPGNNVNNYQMIATPCMF